MSTRLTTLRIESPCAFGRVLRAMVYQFMFNFYLLVYVSTYTFYPISRLPRYIGAPVHCTCILLLACCALLALPLPPVLVVRSVPPHAGAHGCGSAAA